MNNHQLVVNGKYYLLAEIEIYYFSDKHPDPFVHKNPQQQYPHSFYFHRASPMGKYKGGTFKGLDITFGNISQKIWGGYLIRSLYDPETQQFIEGPCNCVNHILKENKMDSINQLVDTLGILDIFTQNPLLSLIKVGNTQEIYSGPRVGLTLKKGDISLKEKYINRSYRLLMFPKKNKKQKGLIIRGLHEEGYSKESIRRLTGSSVTMINKNLQT